MAREPKPTIDRMIRSLQDELILGKAYLVLAKGIAGADPAVRETTKTFFGLTQQASLHMAQILAAKLFDKTTGTVTVNALLLAAKNEAGSFQYVKREGVSEAIRRSRNRIADLEPILTSVRNRRNQALAHLDLTTVLNPQAFEASARLTVPELEKVFDETGAILNEISSLYNGAASYNGVTISFDLAGVHDYAAALKLIADAMCAQIDDYEKKFKQPWSGARPRGCQRP